MKMHNNMIKNKKIEKEILTIDPVFVLSSSKTVPGVFTQMVEILGTVGLIGGFLFFAIYWITDLSGMSLYEYTTLANLVFGTEFWGCLAGLGVITFAFSLIMQYFYPKRTQFMGFVISAMVFMLIGFFCYALTFGILEKYLVFEKIQFNFLAESVFRPYGEFINLHLQDFLRALVGAIYVGVSYILTRFIMKKVYVYDDSFSNMDDLNLEMYERRTQTRSIVSYSSNLYSMNAPWYYLPLVAFLFTAGFLFSVSPFLCLMLVMQEDTLAQIMSLVEMIKNSWQSGNEEDKKKHFMVLASITMGMWMFSISIKHAYFFVGALIGELRKNINMFTAIWNAGSRTLGMSLEIFKSSIRDLLFAVVNLFVYIILEVIVFSFKCMIEKAIQSPRQANSPPVYSIHSFLSRMLGIAYTTSISLIFFIINLDWLQIGMYPRESLQSNEISTLQRFAYHNNWLLIGVCLFFFCLILIPLLTYIQDQISAGGIRNFLNWNSNGTTSKNRKSFFSSNFGKKAFMTLVLFATLGIPSIYQLLLSQRNMADHLAHKLQNEADAMTKSSELRKKNSRARARKFKVSRSLRWNSIRAKE
ncbi:hypothetical protein NECID01_0643 [Nematocida sp. AWRm77]|nr:hypothetical protein NECID01_0643 [Nematocida sp. AWRm77]